MNDHSYNLIEDNNDNLINVIYMRTKNIFLINYNDFDVYRSLNDIKLLYKNLKKQFTNENKIIIPNFNLIIKLINKYKKNYNNNNDIIILIKKKLIKYYLNILINDNFIKDTIILKKFLTIDNVYKKIVKNNNNFTKCPKFYNPFKNCIKFLNKNLFNNNLNKYNIIINNYHIINNNDDNNEKFINDDENILLNNNNNNYYGYNKYLFHLNLLNNNNYKKSKIYVNQYLNQSLVELKNINDLLNNFIILHNEIEYISINCNLNINTSDFLLNKIFIEYELLDNIKLINYCNKLNKLNINNDLNLNKVLVNINKLQINFGIYSKTRSIRRIELLKKFFDFKVVTAIENSFNVKNCKILSPKFNLIQNIKYFRSLIDLNTNLSIYDAVELNFVQPLLNDLKFENNPQNNNITIV